MRLVASARARRHDMFARYREWDGGNQKLWTKKIIVFCFLSFGTDHIFREFENLGFSPSSQQNWRFSN